MRVQRGVDAHVAVDRRHAREPLGGVRRAAAHDAAEGQRARLRADDAQAGRLGQQRGVEGRVALQRGERPEPAVLLGGDGLQHDLGRRRADAAQRRERVQRGDHRALHVHRAAPVQAAVLDHARPRPCPRLGPRPDDVDVPVQAQPAAVAGERRGHAPQLVARRLLAGMVGVRAQRGEVVLVQVGVEPGGLRALGEELERGALVAGDAGDPHQLGGVAGEGVHIQRREGFLLHPSGP